MENDKSGVMKENVPRISLLIRVTVLILLTGIVTFVTVVIMASTRGYFLEKAAEQTVNTAKASATAAMVSIGSANNIKRLYKDEKFRESEHEMFRYICKKTGLRYLYLYTIDENLKRHYLIEAASDDEDDLRINTNYPFNSISETDLHEAEITVMNNPGEGQHEFVNNGYGYVCMYVMPVMSQDGKEILAYIGADYGIDYIRRIRSDYVKLLFVSGVTGFVITSVVCLLWMRQAVLKPVKDVSGKMQNFIQDRNNPPKAGKKLFNDEISDIEISFYKMAGDISQYVRDIEELTRKEANSTAQLEIARNIQYGIVPMKTELSGDTFDAYGTEHSAKRVGGDFYELLKLDEDRVFFIVGDISGKGVSAALFMVMVKTAIREIITVGHGLAETLNIVNDEICRANPVNMFATIFAGTVNIKTGVMKYANAGHNPPLILGRDSRFLEVDPGILLGIMEDSDIQEGEITLQPGETVLIYTDGVTEAMNKDQEFYGTDRLKLASEKADMSGDGPAAKLVEAVVASVYEFSDGLAQFDDITCAAVTYRK